MRCLYDSSICTLLKGGLHIESSWTRNYTRNLCHVRDSSSLSVLRKFREYDKSTAIYGKYGVGIVEKFLSHHDSYSVDRKYTAEM